MKQHAIDMADPSPEGEIVEVKTPAGIIRVIGGVVEPATGKPRVVVEFSLLEWQVELRKTPGRTDAVLTRIETAATDPP